MAAAPLRKKRIIRKTLTAGLKEAWIFVAVILDFSPRVIMRIRSDLSLIADGALR
jgi:hypothetical protein